MTVTTGSCLCGEVRFRVSAFSGGIFQCHCSRCRKSTGAAASAAVLAPAEAFSWEQGSERLREWRAESGFVRRFCPDCGSAVPQLLPQHKLYWIPAGLLDGDPGLRLRRHIHVDSRAAWDVLDPDTPQLPGGPEQR